MAQKVQTESVSMEALVAEFEQKLERVKILYEQYFMGIEKREPRIPLHEVVRLMRELDKVKMHNTRLRYRYRSLVQRFNTYRTYWHRTLRAMETGTYHRDLARLRRKWSQQGLDVHMPTTGRLRSPGEVEKAVEEALRNSEAKKELEEPKKRRQVPAEIRGRAAEELKHEYTGAPPARSGPAPSPTARPAPPATAPVAAAPLPDGFSHDQMQSLYRRYVKAKRMVGEDVSGIRYETLAQSLAKQVPRLKEINQGRDVDFEVVIRQGKVVLKAKSK